MVNVTVKRRGKRSRHVGTRETSESDPLGKASKKPTMAPKPGLTLGPGSSMEGTCLLAMRCPVQKRRESSLGFRTELENRAGDDKGKGTSGSPARPKVQRRQPGTDCSVVVKKRGNARGAKGAGHPRRDQTESTGQTGGTRWSRRKAAVFNGWHEPDESRDSSPDL